MKYVRQDVQDDLMNEVDAIIRSRVDGEIRLAAIALVEHPMEIVLEHHLDTIFDAAENDYES